MRYIHYTSGVLATLLFVVLPVVGLAQNQVYDLTFIFTNTQAADTTVTLEAEVYPVGSVVPATQNLEIAWKEDGVQSYTNTDTVTIWFDQQTEQAPFSYTFNGLQAQTSYDYRISNANDGSYVYVEEKFSTTATGGSSSGGSNSLGGNTGSGGSNPLGGGAGSGGSTPSLGNVTRLQNPIAPETVDELVETLLNGAMVIAVPIIALFIIYAGFLFVTARGNPERLTKAKETLLYTLIGAAILLGAWTIVNIIKGTFNALQ